MSTRPAAAAPAPLLAAVTLAVSLFMLAPMLLSVVAGLVNNYSAGLRSGLTTRWLAQVWESYGDTVSASLLIGLSCVAATVVLGVPCAYMLARSRSRAARLFEELLTLPVAVPGLATALALILVYGQMASFRQSYGFILVGHVVFTLPFMVRIVSAAFQRDELRALEEAARTLGASFVQRFLGVLVPAVFPAIVAGCLMVFTLSIGEFNLTWMLHTPLTPTASPWRSPSVAIWRRKWPSKKRSRRRRCARSGVCVSCGARLRSMTILASRQRQASLHGQPDAFRRGAGAGEPAQGSRTAFAPAPDRFSRQILHRTS